MKNSARIIAELLSEFGKCLRETELPNDVQTTERIMKLQQQERDAIKEDFRISIRKGLTLLRQVRHTEQSQNVQQLRFIFDAYQKLTGNSIEKALDSEFSDEKFDALMDIVSFVRKGPSGVLSRLMQKAIKGTPNDELLVHLIYSYKRMNLMEMLQDEFKHGFKKQCFPGSIFPDGSAVPVPKQFRILTVPGTGSKIGSEFFAREVEGVHGAEAVLRQSVEKMDKVSKKEKCGRASARSLQEGWGTRAEPSLVAGRAREAFVGGRASAWSAFTECGGGKGGSPFGTGERARAQPGERVKRGERVHGMWRGHKVEGVQGAEAGKMRQSERAQPSLAGGERAKPLLAGGERAKPSLAGGQARKRAE
uniref:Annexin n=1 Tax=Globodera pallida TaxID=36090 RepID=A0A183C5F0_GLOPA